MIEVYFLNSKKEERLLESVEDVKSANKVVEKFLEDHNFKSYYTRVLGMENKEGVMLDVGSHSEFFIFKGEGVYDFYFGVKG